MATWKCEKCGYTKEGRCKPRKCEQCTAARQLRQAGVTALCPSGDLNAALAPYRALLNQVDQLCARITAAFPDQIACRAGCAACCTLQGVMPVEAVSLALAWRRLPAADAAALRTRLAAVADDDRLPAVERRPLPALPGPADYLPHPRPAAAGRGCSRPACRPLPAQLHRPRHPPRFGDHRPGAAEPGAGRRQPPLSGDLLPGRRHPRAHPAPADTRLRRLPPTDPTVRIFEDARET